MGATAPIVIQVLHLNGGALDSAPGGKLMLAT